MQARIEECNRRGIELKDEDCVNAGMGGLRRAMHGTPAYNMWEQKK